MYVDEIIAPLLWREMYTSALGFIKKLAAERVHSKHDIDILLPSL